MSNDSEYKVVDRKDLFDKVRSGYIKLNCSQMNKEVKVESGMKFDSGKEEHSLLPKGALKPVLRALGFGAKKYAKDNWQKVPNAKERYFNALHRHLNSWWEGERVDQETGESHLAHAACCLLFLLWFDLQEEQTGENKGVEDVNAD